MIRRSIGISEAVNNGIYWFLNYVACDVRTESDRMEYSKKLFKKWTGSTCPIDWLVDGLGCSIAILLAPLHFNGMLNQNQPRFLSRHCVPKSIFLAKLYGKPNYGLKATFWIIINYLQLGERIKWIKVHKLKIFSKCAYFCFAISQPKTTTKQMAT